MNDKVQEECPGRRLGENDLPIIIKARDILLIRVYQFIAILLLV